ncbi:FAD:protein FMN transferase [Ferrimonas marina]|uniref:FAD:protein FMN transferase n=1 Tax=Ferrimonas marina TaxID=299255 RepID=A0A1M5XSG2_9GAMM|nr:FAD:protein FMN transferase [Ferrimonas marina]SHI02740.1 thiamine biosynthesis lipoprotein [Ferrimonas marina]
MRLWLLLISLISATCWGQPVHQQIHGHTMGSAYEIHWSTLYPRNPAKLKAGVEELLVEVNASMSHFDPESQLSQFNRSEHGTPVDGLFATVMAEAILLHHETHGALDVTIAPLVELWGFGAQGETATPPAQSEIEQALARSGMHRLKLEDQHLVKQSAELTVNLGAIAKGFAVDQIAELLVQSGIRDFLINVGGEMRVQGVKADGSPWRIGIEHPDSEGQHHLLIIEPGNSAVATSGDYRNYFESAGQRFSHLIDPRSGMPISNGIASATVIHSSSMRADGYATAASVLGVEAALAMATELNMALMLVEVRDGQLVLHESPAFVQIRGAG